MTPICGRSGPTACSTRLLTTQQGRLQLFLTPRFTASCKAYGSVRFLDRWGLDRMSRSKLNLHVSIKLEPAKDLEIKRNIRITLKFVMSKMDLDIATPKEIQESVVEKMPNVELEAYKKYIDTEVL